MKLITLNLWGGRVKKPLIEFILAHADTDVFCFQEMYHDAAKKSRGDFRGADLDLYSNMKSLLPNHVASFCATVDDYYGIATFIKKDIDVRASGEISIYENALYDGTGGTHGRKMLWHEVAAGKPEMRILSVLNVHGLWTGKGKTDTPDRIEQSRRIKEFVDSLNGPRILCGDFNLAPDTQSLMMLEKGMQNLVRDHNFTSTRTSLYTRADASGKFADYILASPDIKVIDFKVLPDEVSDHAALYVEFRD